MLCILGAAISVIVTLIFVLRSLIATYRPLRSLLEDLTSVEDEEE